MNCGLKRLLIIILDGHILGKKFMMEGKLSFCSCSRGKRCPSFLNVLCIMCKLCELCLFSLGRGYNLGLSYFGVGEISQKMLVSGWGYTLDKASGVYILTNEARASMEGSKFIAPAIPSCVFDCVRLVSSQVPTRSA